MMLLVYTQVIREPGKKHANRSRAGSLHRDSRSSPAKLLPPACSLRRCVVLSANATRQSFTSSPQRAGSISPLKLAVGVTRRARSASFLANQPSRSGEKQPGFSSFYETRQER